MGNKVPGNKSRNAAMKNRLLSRTTRGFLCRNTLGENISEGYSAVSKN